MILSFLVEAQKSLRSIVNFKKEEFDKYGEAAREISGTDEYEYMETR